MYSWETNDNVEHIITWMAGFCPCPRTSRRGQLGHFGTFGTPIPKNNPPKLFHMDAKIVDSLGERIINYKPFTEAQGKLALKYVRKYKSLLAKNGFNVEQILEDEKFFWALVKKKVQINYRLMVLEERNDKFYIDIAFPFDEQLINKLKYCNSVIRANNHYSFDTFKWDKENLKWFTIPTATSIEEVMKIANEYNFFVGDDLLDLFELYVKEKENIARPIVSLNKNILTFSNITEGQKKGLEGLI